MRISEISPKLLFSKFCGMSQRIFCVFSIFSKLSCSQFCWIRLKYKFFAKNMRFFTEFLKCRVSPIFLEFLVSHSVIFRDNREFSEKIWKISQNFSENWKMRKSEIIPEKYFHQEKERARICLPGKSAEYEFLLELGYNIIRKLLETPLFFIHYVSNTNLWKKKHPKVGVWRSPQVRATAGVSVVGSRSARFARSAIKTK